MFRSFIAMSPLLASMLAFAASADAAGADPLDAKAQIPPLHYRSSMEGYRRFGDERPAPWKEANETAARIGGWRAYARETRDGAASAAGVAPAAPASAPGSGHQGHGK